LVFQNFSDAGLDVLSLALPPLRERGKDVLLLAKHLIRRFAERYDLSEPRLDGESMAFLLTHTWPGNVRELENLIHRELLMSDGSVLHIDPSRTEGPNSEEELAANMPNAGDLPLSLGFSRAKQLAIGAFERSFLTRALSESDGNVTLAARLVKKERRAFGRLMKKHGIDGDRRRS